MFCHRFLIPAISIMFARADCLNGDNCTALVMYNSQMPLTPLIPLIPLTHQIMYLAQIRPADQLIISKKWDNSQKQLIIPYKKVSISRKHPKKYSAPTHYIHEQFTTFTPTPTPTATVNTVHYLRHGDSGAYVSSIIMPLMACIISIMMMLRPPLI